MYCGRRVKEEVTSVLTLVAEVSTHIYLGYLLSHLAVVARITTLPTQLANEHSGSTASNESSTKRSKNDDKMRSLEAIPSQFEVANNL